MKPAFPVHEERQRSRLQPVLFPPFRVGMPQGALDRFCSVPRRSNRVLEAMPRRILIIIQIPFRPGAIWPGIETVDEHARD